MTMERERMWDRIVKIVVGALITLWAGWVSGMVVALKIADAECKQWRSARPSFVTSDQQKLDLLQKEKELREMFNQSIEAKLTEFSKRLDKVNEGQQEVIKGMTAIDKKLAEHMAKP